MIYGEKSKAALETCDNRLQIIFNEAIKVMDIKILEGHRNEEDQNAAYNARPQRSKIKWPDGRHNKKPSEALDAVPYPVDWEDRESFFYMAGIVMGIAKGHGFRLRWGGNWKMDNDFKGNKFDDLPHFELKDIL